MSEHRKKVQINSWWWKLNVFSQKVLLFSCLCLLLLTEALITVVLYYHLLVCSLHVST